MAGQINGTSGYEEAAAQGLLAGINAARYAREREAVVLGRDQAYIGVLIDDLVSRDHTEPYRMHTSRAEYRLLLRQDNADERLGALGYSLGLVPEARYRATQQRVAATQDALRRLHSAGLSRANAASAETLIADDLELPHTAESLLRRPGATYDQIRALVDDPVLTGLPGDVAAAVQVRLAYAGYLEQQERQIARAKKMEDDRIPSEINYALVPNLRTEAREKLVRFQPLTLGQAARVAGVTPADISVLMVWLHRRRVAV
jgi:tRNA uridine 5-carboxymethylaminomethyl modification enzyme